MKTFFLFLRSIAIVVLLATFSACNAEKVFYADPVVGVEGELFTLTRDGNLHRTGAAPEGMRRYELRFYNAARNTLYRKRVKDAWIVFYNPRKDSFIVYDVDEEGILTRSFELRDLQILETLGVRGSIRVTEEILRNSTPPVGPEPKGVILKKRKPGA